MFNTKNIMIIIFAALVAALLALSLEEAISMRSFINYFISGMLTGVLILLAQSITSTTRSSTAHSKKIPSSQKSASKTSARHEPGTVKWFDTNKGYGFITRASGEDIFVHFRSIKGSGYRSLHEGQKVEFVVTQGDKGPQAEDIHIIT